MTPKVFTSSVKKICFRPRISFILSIAERACKTFSSEDELFKKIDHPFDIAWVWLSDQSNTALDIYEAVQPLHGLCSEFKDDKKQLSAIFSAISALYYTSWEVEAFEFTYLKRDNSSKFGGDFFEISDSFISDTREHALTAVENPKSETLWQEKTIKSLLEKHSLCKKGELSDFFPRGSL